MSHRSHSSSSKKKRSPREKKQIIREYEQRYGVRLSEEELDELLDEAFSDSAFSNDTKESVSRRLKDRKKKKGKPKKEAKPAKKSE
ncbi:TPA: hypothetical protein EYP38_04205 [Candidatus Micrarchaeota archaeon]|nr:hypothetical protein [Candidatus Micrarchaeota archaeon]